MMNTYQKSMEQMTRSWSNLNSQILDAWRQAVERQVSSYWGVPANPWRPVLEGMVHAQAEWTRMLGLCGVTSGAVARPLEPWTEQIRPLARCWVAAQKQMCDSWCKLLSESKGNGIEARTGPSELLNAWQTVGQRLVESQIAWLTSMTPSPPRGRSPGGGKPKPPRTGRSNTAEKRSR